MKLPFGRMEAGVVPNLLGEALAGDTLPAISVADLAGMYSSLLKVIIGFSS